MTLRRLAGLGLAAALAAPPAFAQIGTDVTLGQAAFAAQCAICHVAGGGQGPDLAGVVGRPAGGAPGFAYSRALRDARFSWDDARLDRFLTDPQAFLPGTTMPVRVEEAARRRDLIAYLARLTPAARIAPRPLATATTPQGADGVVVFGDWRLDAPGVRHRVSVADLPAPHATRSSSNGADLAPPPPGALPRTLPGLRVSVFASGLAGPRLLRTAPNGDVFVAESNAGRISVIRAPDGAASADAPQVFASGLKEPFGIAFYPAGPDPRWIYVAETNRVVRFAYRLGARRASSPPQVIVETLASTGGGHSLRDLAFTRDGRRMFVSVGSGSNVAETMTRKTPAETVAFAEAQPLGAAWGAEAHRADVLEFTPEGGPARVFATGLRNCGGVAVQPDWGDLWCAVNERDQLGDNLVPDYVTRVHAGGFYGWPWYYLGDHEDPRRRGERPDLVDRSTIPDVLLQPHSAPLQPAFYEGAMFPEWRGSILVALHGSWNRAERTGYKLIRIPVGPDGAAVGGYEDVLTGFVLGDDRVWGRPVGVTVAHDGAILVSDDASNRVWRIAR